MSAFMKVTDEAYRLKLNWAPEEPAALSGLVAARRDTAAFQLILQSDLQYSVNVGRGEWISAKGRHLGPHERLRVAVSAPFEVKLQLEDLLTDDDEVLKADVLLNQSVREERANVPSAVWAEVRVPEDAQPGEYTVKVKLFSAMYGQDETMVAEAEIPLTVAEYVMPEAKDWKFYLDLWQHTSNIARKHDVPLWSDEHFEVLKSYADSLAALGQKSITVCASEIPWDGQSCYVELTYKGNVFEYSMIPVTRRVDGSWHYDYSIMQRYIDLCTKAGISGDIEIFGLVNVWTQNPQMPKEMCPDYPEQLRIRYLDEADGCLKYVRDAEVFKDYIRSLEKYFIETKQIERVRIAADEPGDVEKYRTSLAMLAELAPNFRCKCAINHAEFIEEFHDRIDDFVPYLRCTVVEYDRLMQYYKDYPDKRFLWYVCCGGASPNNFLRTALIENRMTGLMTSKLRLDGFLRWNYCIWPDDPRKDIRYSHFEAGDTNFVYPGYNGKVLLSLRYKNLQRGIADYEMLEAIRAAKGDEVADALLAKVIHIENVKDFYDENRCKSSEEMFSLTFEDYNALKAEMLKVLSL